MRVFPGLAPGDTLPVNDGKTRLSLQDAAAGIKAIYEDMLDRAWSEARAPRATSCPPSRRRRSRRPCRGSNETPALAILAASRSLALALPAAAFAHDQPENEPVAAG